MVCLPTSTNHLVYLSAILFKMQTTPIFKLQRFFCFKDVQVRLNKHGGSVL